MLTLDTNEASNVRIHAGSSPYEDILENCIPSLTIKEVCCLLVSGITAVIPECFSTAPATIPGPYQGPRYILVQQA